MRYRNASEGNQNIEYRSAVQRRQSAPRPSASRRHNPPQAPKDVGSDQNRAIPSPACAVEPRQSQSEVEPE
jgi:hypothetical protein